MRKLFVLVLLLVLAGMLLGVVPAADTGATGAGKMYWTGGGSIWRANLDGSGAEEVVPGVSGWDIELDLAAGQAYLTGGHTIRRVNLDGGGVEDLVTGLDMTWDIALDLTSGKMYWTEPYVGKVQSANLDGSDVENLLVWTLIPVGIALDSVSRQVYLTDRIPEGPGHWYEEGLVWRVGLDGSGGRTLAAEIGSGPWDIALDVPGGKVYWADPDLDKIRRGNLDGSEIEDLITGPTVGWGIALDVPGLPVGGVAELRQLAGAPVEGRESSALPAWFLAGALAAAAMMLGCAAWWKKRRPRS